MNEIRPEVLPFNFHFHSEVTACEPCKEYSHTCCADCMLPRLVKIGAGIMYEPEADVLHLANTTQLYQCNYCGSVWELRCNPYLNRTLSPVWGPIKNMKR